MTKKINFNRFRKKYLNKIPKKNGIRVILIAESPPAQNRDLPKFFYYDKDDLQKEEIVSLFGRVMTGLYPVEWKRYSWTGKSVGNNKRKMLKRFSRDGFYLMDATDESLQDEENSEKRKKLRAVNKSGKLTKKLTSLAKRRYLRQNTEIYIVSCMVYDIFFDSLVKVHISMKDGDIDLSKMLSNLKTSLPFGPNNDNVVRFMSLMEYLRKRFRTS